MTLKIIISAGGTGGHLFPAIAFIFLTYGLIKLVRRYKISKDEKITRLEKRLDDMEKDKAKKL